MSNRTVSAAARASFVALAILVLVSKSVRGDVLWDQPLSASNPGAYVDQVFPDVPTYSAFLADDFTNAQSWTITKIYIPGDGWNGFSTLTNAVALNWEIRADSSGTPDGVPAEGAAPQWNLSLPASDAQVAIEAGTSGYPSRVTLTLDTPITLPAGTWWLVFYPTMPYSGGGQYGRQPADTSNGAVAKFINPGGGFGQGTAWQNWNVLGASQTDLAFRLEGTAGAVAEADLSIEKVADRGAGIDGPISYTISVSNSGPSQATGVVVTDPLPDQVAYVSNSCGGTYTAATHTWTWTVGTLAAEANASCTLVVSLVPDRGGRFTNTATVTSDVSDPDGANGAASATFLVTMSDVPAVDARGLLVLSLLLAAAGALVVRRFTV